MNDIVTIKNKNTGQIVKLRRKTIPETPISEESSSYEKLLQQARTPNKTVPIIDKIVDYILPKWATEAKFEQDTYNIYGDIGERIPGAIRAGFQGKNILQGYMAPSQIPSTATAMYLAEEKDLTGNKVKDVVGAIPSAIVGETIDMALNPFTYIGGALAKTPGIGKVGGQVASKLGSWGGTIQKIAQPALKPLGKMMGGVAKNIKLTFGSPMRNFRKFVTKQKYTEENFRNLPIKDQIIAQSRKVKTISGLEEQKLSEQLGGIGEEIQKAKGFKGSFEELVSGTKQGISKQKKLLRQQKQSEFALQRINDRNANRVIADNIKMLDEELTIVSERGAEDIQPLLKEFFKANSKAYGERLDEYSKLLEESGKPLTIGKAFAILDDTVADLDEMNIISGRGRMLIDKLKAQYYPYNEEGTLIKNLDEVIDFKLFNKEVRDILHSLSASARSGIKLNEDDLAQVMLHKNYGGYVADNVPAFQELQQTYRPVIEGMKTTGKIFKPYASEFQKTQGTQFLKKAALGELTTPEAKTLEFMEKGTGFAPGVGDVSGQAKTIGGKIIQQKGIAKSLKVSQREKLDDMVARFNQNINALDEEEMGVNKLLAERSFELSQQIDELEKGKNVIQKSIETARLKGELRQLQLAERKLRIEKMLHIKRKATIIKYTIAGALSFPTGIPQTIGRWGLRAVLGESTK